MQGKENERENLIKTAVNFLKNPKVAGKDKDKIRSFFISKGLTDEDIQEAYKRVAMPEQKPSILEIIDKPKISLPSNLTQRTNFSHQNLALFPEIFSKPSTKFLVASFNKIPSLPSKIIELYDLEYLNLSNNNFTDQGLPDEFFSLSSLKDLDLSNNQLIAFERFTRLSKLKKLNLSSNLIIEISDNIVNLQELEYLWLHRNKISSVSPRLALLINLKQLVSIYIDSFWQSFTS